MFASKTTDEEDVKWLKAPEHILNGPCEINHLSFCLSSGPITTETSVFSMFYCNNEELEDIQYLNSRIEHPATLYV